MIPILIGALLELVYSAQLYVYWKQTAVELRLSFVKRTKINKLQEISHQQFQ